MTIDLGSEGRERPATREAASTQRRLVAIVSADVVDYSRLMGADESGTLATLCAHRDELWNPTIEHFGGRVVGTAGDSILVEFASTVAAAECSISVQNGMAEQNADLPDDQRMLLRIGINIGEVIIEADDIYGDGVNVAARLQEIAEPGGIAVSGNVHEQIEGKLDSTFYDDGLHKLKNITRSVPVWRWLPQGTDFAAKTAVPSANLKLPDKPSIAVLPFDNMSGDPEQEYLADGIVEDVLTNLSQIHELFVIARNSSFSYKGQHPDPRKVAEELGVRYILEGSLRQAGTRVRITAQLIDGLDGSHLWAERYDRELTDIFELQDEITKKITTALQVRLTEGQQIIIRRNQTASFPAWLTSVRLKIE